MKITIAHLYPDLLNLYGDNGNIAALSYRLRKRNISVEVVEYQIGDSIDFNSTDILFIGGGSDKEMLTVANEICSYSNDLKTYAENGGCILAVCGGYELLGNFYIADGKKVECTGILNISAIHKNKRHIGNVVAKCELIGSDVAGFENHSGSMNIGDYTPLMRIVSGYGNNGTGYEGVVYKNVIGTYLHGPILPKNAALTDYIISKAIEKKYGKTELSVLDDTVENLALEYAVANFSK